jgi:hypothetical protein
MNPRVVKVLPEKDYMLRLKFANGEVKRFDMKPYLDFPVFQPLKNEALFKQARVFLDTVQWPNQADLCPDTFYMDSVPVEE